MWNSICTTASACLASHREDSPSPEKKEEGGKTPHAPGQKGGAAHCATSDLCRLCVDSLLI
jgi:hypothetical protein